MIQSMTGFGSKTLALTLDDGTAANVVFSVKALNSRYFEATCKLPQALSILEPEFIKIFRKTLHRGHIYFTISVSNPSIFKGKVEPSLNTIQGYLTALDTVKKQFNIEGSLTLGDIIELPNIFNIQEKSIDEASKKLIFDATQEIIDLLVTMRIKEGAALKVDLDERIARMQKEIVAIEKDAHVLMERKKEEVHKALHELDADEETLADIQKKALYAVLDKIDINEEIVRFKSHVQSLSTHLDSPAVEKGKRLDFTLQELGREINTIAAKCSDAAIGARAINIKVELEKAREQAQNIV